MAIFARLKSGLMISTQEELNGLKQQLRRQLTESIADVISSLKEVLTANPSKADTLLMLESRLNEANRDKLRGVIGQENLQLVYARLRADLLSLISGLELADFTGSGGGQRQAGRTGSLLYRVPEQMPLGKESKCIIRLAFEEESLIRNIELTEDITIKPIRIAQVMDVELVDPNSEPAFRIRSLSTAEQFVERGDYTEWLFFVKPLRAGTFPLLMKIAVIEIIQGKERKKEIVLEEEVRIVAAATLPEADTLAFKTSGYELTVSSRSTAPLAPAPGAPLQPPQFRQVQDKTPTTHRPSLMRPLSIAASMLVIATLAIFVYRTGNFGFTNDHASSSNTEPSDPGASLSGAPVGNWIVRKITTATENQAQQDANFAEASPIYYRFLENNTLIISSKVSKENAQYNFQPPDQLAFKAQTWDGAGKLLFRSRDSLALALTISYPGGYVFPMTVEFNKAD